MPKQFSLLIGVLILGLMAVACSQVESALTPSPTTTFSPTNTPVPRQTPYPTYTLYPTYTPFPVVASPEGTAPASTPTPAIAAPTTTPLLTPAPTVQAPTPVLPPGAILAYYRDADVDGFGDPEIFLPSDFHPPGWVINNADCDDNDSSVNPEAVEVLDGKDNDCDGQVDEVFWSAIYYLDNDGDGYGNPMDSIEAASSPAGYVPNDGDCDDTDGSVNPEAIEVLDNKDNDCDGQVDEGLSSAVYYGDRDGDGYGNPLGMIEATSPPPGYVVNNGDCDDINVSVHPGAGEVPDGVDNNCNGQVDEDLGPTVYYADNDGDGYGDTAAFIDASSQPLGYVTKVGDCDDGDSSVNPSAIEVLDSKDNDCDGQVDEDLVSSIYFLDNDGDGYGNPQEFIVAASPPPGYVDNPSDCNDADVTVNPGAAERDDDIDHNCNGRADDV